jgi:histidinol phosphatase-like enzyme (inositol monophosphatase family)
MPQYNITELERFANLLADASGEVIRKYYRNFGEIIAKGDASPVTIADQETEIAIRNLIQDRHPEHGIQGEEFGIYNADAQFKWVIDPIDGTASFMIGRPVFGTLIALLYKNKPIIGIIDQPINNERWVGVENGEAIFYQNNMAREISTRTCSKLSDAILSTTGPNYFSKKGLEKFNKIADKVRYNVYGGDCYNYALLAMGMVDIIVESGLKPHDFLALRVVVEQAGGIATNWQGEPLDINSGGDVVFCGDKKIHAEILEMLQ